LLRSGFDEVAFELDPSERFAVGTARFSRAPVTLAMGERMFTFIDGLWPRALDG
jgi:hypothetical protein